jgi:hypothetical protein
MVYCPGVSTLGLFFCILIAKPINYEINLPGSPTTRLSN